MKVLVTGGCGFIGSNFINYLLTSSETPKDIYIINIDKQTYAGKGKNIEHLKLEIHPRYKFIKADISDKQRIQEIFKNEQPDFVFNFAAESHVDRSIYGSEPFIESNIKGISTLLDSAKKFPVKKFIQISTDEVYGSTNEKSFNEEDILNPSSPYSASKASAEHLASAYFKTHKIPIIITRSANNYGPYQFPEKLLPLFITNLIENKKVPLMWSEENPGLNIRDWLHVEDNCRAIWFLSQKGKEGEIYNIPGENEKTNIEMTRRLLKNFNKEEDSIEKIPHREAHDFRYSIKGDKLKSLGFQYKHLNLDLELNKLCDWYKENQEWWKSLKNTEKGFVLGAGFLGNRLAEELRYKLIGKDELNPLDINKLKEFLKKEKPDIIINAIGKTGRPNIDWCEENKEETILGNITVPMILSTICSEKNIYFVHLGSGCIYKGNNDYKGFSEEDEPNFYGPQFYAKTKIISERILSEYPGLILRIRMPIDDLSHPRNLIDKLLKYNKLISVQNSMTTIPHMIEAIKQLIKKRANGIYNLVNPGTISATEIIEMYKELINPAHIFKTFSIEELNSITKGERSNCVLNTDKLNKEGIELPEIHQAVRQCLLNYKDNLNK